jgi:glucose/arabinose dehydrogenase
MARRALACAVLALAGLAPAACAQVTGPVAISPERAPEAQGYRVETVAEGLNRPWGLAFLPDGAMLVTEKDGALLRLTPLADGASAGAPARATIAGVPPVFSGGQGGLMDVALHPRFAENSLVYLTLSEGTGEANRTVLVRATLAGDRLENVQTIFRVSQQKRGGQHFGSRILWLPDGTMLLAIGDGGNPPTSLDGRLIRLNAQERSSHLGKILRLNDDGTPAADNPFAGEQGAAPEVWSYGHRNIQGLTRDPESGRVWATEHGARGGDELNLVRAGANFGWPAVTYSREYMGPRISEETTREGMVDPKAVWTPAQAPSGLAFYTGDAIPAWRGSLFSGGLVTGEIRRLTLEGEKVTGEESIRIGQRVRDVRQGPDGMLYVLTDERDGRLLRLAPAATPAR